MNASEPLKHRILVIDDNRGIHADFRKILLCGDDDQDGIAEISSELFGAGPAKFPRPRFQVDSAFQGLEGLERVAEARRGACPYALAFVDVRMPPGLDGIQTTAELWQIDPDLQVVICTAYSDY